MSLSRRQLIARIGALGVAAASPLQALYTRSALGQSITGVGFGPLIPDPNRLLDLPAEFKYRAISRTGQIMTDGNPVPSGHDGMATFPGPNGTTILVRNHELSRTSSTTVIAPPELKYDTVSRGGTTTLVVGANRRLISHHASLAGTTRNCAGGPTPWGSYITCEETTEVINGIRHGFNFEVPSLATGVVTPVPLVAMGRFSHEAVAIDPATGIVYETEDQGDSLFYRFIPTVQGNLTAGVLQALRIIGQPNVNTAVGFPVGQAFAVDWVTIADPDPLVGTTRSQGQALGAARFTRGEGAIYTRGEIYFVSTNGGSAAKGQVWRYVPGATAAEGGTIELFIEPNNGAVLDGPDNIVDSPFGDFFLCEDGGGEQFVVGVTPEGQLYPFARNAGGTSEFAGACFSPDGKTMFVNVQSPGITFAIWGPFPAAI